SDNLKPSRPRCHPVPEDSPPSDGARVRVVTRSGWPTASVSMTDVTRILSNIESGDPRAAEDLLPLVYDELRRLAAQRLAQEKPAGALGAAARAQGASLGLVDGEKATQGNGGGFFSAAAAGAMRRIRVGEARRKRAEIRGGDRRRVGLAEGDWISRATPE